MLVASFLLTVSIGRASEKTEGKTPWKITGQLEEACSCDAACPCWFDSKPTKMKCSGGQVLFIEKGIYGKTKLDGLAIANMSQSPAGKTMMGSFGDWNFSYNYIDEKANPEQRKALEAIANVVLEPGASKKTETRYVAIIRKTEGNIVMHTAASTAYPLHAPGQGAPTPLVLPAGVLPARIGIRTVGFQRGTSSLALTDESLA